jgi:predicted dehydrogenase
MRLALVCDDSGVVPWLDALRSDATHEITLAATVTPAAAEFLRGRSGIRLTSHWQDMLGARDVDAVLVGGSSPETLEATKQLATAGQPLLFLPCSDQGSTFLYEMGLVRDDNRVLICPALWHRRDRATRRLWEIVRNESSGRVQLLQFERTVSSPAGASTLNQSTVDAALLFDVDLLRWLGGDYDQVTALRTGESDAGVMMQSVKLAGRGLPEATWSIQAGAVSRCRLTVHGERGRAVLEVDADTGEWSLGESEGSRVAGDCHAAVRSLLDEFAAAINADAVHRAVPPVEWSDLVKAFETVDATHRSIRRRRTIELHFEPMSERAIFKTQMTAIGCGVLTLTLLLMLVYLAVAGTVPLPNSVLLMLRGLVFAPLAVFLLLQLLYPLARPSSHEGRANDSANANGGDDQRR